MRYHLIACPKGQEWSVFDDVHLRPIHDHGSLPSWGPRPDWRRSFLYAGAGGEHPQLEAGPGEQRVRLPRRLSRLTSGLSAPEVYCWLRGEPPPEGLGGPTAEAWAAAKRGDYDRLEHHGLRVDAFRSELRMTTGAEAWLHFRGQRLTSYELLPDIVRALWELAYPDRGLGFPRRLPRRVRGNLSSMIEEVRQALSSATGIPADLLLGTTPSGFDHVAASRTLLRQLRVQPVWTDGELRFVDDPRAGEDDL